MREIVAKNLSAGAPFSLGPVAGPAPPIVSILTIPALTILELTILEHLVSTHIVSTLTISTLPKPPSECSLT